MLKTFSAALLAVSVFAAPALAATGKTAQQPVTKSVSAKPAALNANARMDRHHVKHSRHYRSHNKMATNKAHPSSKIAVKHATHPAKRG